MEVSHFSVENLSDVVVMQQCCCCCFLRCPQCTCPQRAVGVSVQMFIKNPRLWQEAARYLDFYFCEDMRTQTRTLNRIE